MPTQNGVLKKDDNDYPVMGGTSSADNQTIINSAFNPVTRRLLTSASGGGTGTVTSITAGTGLTATPTNPITTTGTILLDSKLAPLDTLGSAGQLIRVNAGATALEYFTAGGGSGTVTSVSVVSANGFTGTVATATTTPAITISTTVNSPVLAGDGTAINAATTTGSGSTVVLQTSPTLITPALGVATATSINGVTIPSTTDTVALLGATQTFTGVNTFSPTARASGVASYFTITTPADTGITAATESIGVNHVTNTRTWATTGTVALQRENFFAGPTYASAGASQTFTDAFTLYATPPVAGTNAIFTRGHTLGIVDGTNAANSITGAFIVATTLGTTATSVGIGAGNINAGGTIVAGSALSSLSGTTSLKSTIIAGLTGSTALTITQTARTAGVLPYIKITIPTDTGQTASTESPGLQTVTGTRTWATTGTVATQREYLWVAPTYASASASQTFTTAATMAISGAPIAGTNAIITSAYALWVQGGTTQLDGGVATTTLSASSTLTASTTIELGNATDTTLSRVSAGVIAVEGVTVPTISSTNTLTNKRIGRRVVTTTQSATPTINSDNTDVANITGLAQAITSMTTNLSGTPVDKDFLEIDITDNGTARAITWGTSFEATTVALPTTTVISTQLSVIFKWNAVASKWDCVGVA